MKSKELDNGFKKNALKLITGLIALLILTITIIVSQKTKVYLAERELALSKSSLDASIAKKSTEAFNMGKAEGISETKATFEKLSNNVFKPIIKESLEQAAKSLALTVYGETRSESPADREVIAWAIINRVIDERDSAIYRNTVSAVVAASDQYDGIKPYLAIVAMVVWGDNLDYVPKSAREVDSDDGKAWIEIVTMVNEVLTGKHSRKTLATHFYSPSADKDGRFPDWIRYLKPIGVAGKHLLYVDYVVKEGKTIYFTKENPYIPKLHD